MSAITAMRYCDLCGNLWSPRYLIDFHAYNPRAPKYEETDVCIWCANLIADARDAHKEDEI